MPPIISKNLEEKMAQKETLFVSDAAELKLRDSVKDKDGKMMANEVVFAKFSPFFTIDEVKNQKVRKGYLKTADEELIKKLETYPTYNIAYKKVDRLPIMFSGNSIVQGVITHDSRSDQINVKEIEKAVKGDVVAKSRRYLELQLKLFKKDGEKRTDASEEELNEFYELKKYLEE